MLKDTLRQVAVIFLAIAQIIVSSFPGAKIGEVSNLYPNYVIPADYAFIIWSLIFLLSLAYAVFQLLPSQRENPLFRATGWFSAAAFFANCVWMIVFPQKLIGLSVLVMFGILGSLALFIANLYQFETTLTVWQRRLAYTTFSIFFGWITVATVVNITIWLVASGWNGFGIPAATWGVAMLIVTGLLASALIYLLRGNLPYGLTVIWALIGVFVNQWFALIKTASPAVAAVAVAMILLIAAVILLSRRPPIEKSVAG